METAVRCGECGRVFEGAVVNDRFGGVCPRCLAGFAMATEATATPEEAPLPLQPGAKFKGLEVLKVLGRGGMGVVYKARQVELGRTVALKVLAPELADDPEFADRFNREARALAALSHPNIVTVHEFGREGNLCYLAMEFIEGRSLRDVMGERRLETGVALGLMAQICGALEYAHAQGVVHRDIKPENILVDPTGRVKIADFGLAKVGRGVLPTLTRTDMAMGTPAYMAPEQYERMKDVDHRADIFSLGVMFYEMVTGELPVVGRFDPPSKRAGIDEGFDRIVLKALEKEPERRYQRAAHVKTDIELLSRPRAPFEEVEAQAPGEKLGKSARRAIAAATRHAQRTGAMYVGTEHLLLGVAAADEEMLKAVGIHPPQVGQEVERVLSPAPATKETPPLTPAARRAIALGRAAVEAGQELEAAHILLGLLRLREGIAFTVLSKLGVKEAAVEEVVRRPRPFEAPSIRRVLLASTAALFAMSVVCWLVGIHAQAVIAAIVASGSFCVLLWRSRR